MPDAPDDRPAEPVTPWLRRAAGLVAPALAAACLARAALPAVLARAAGPAVPLDDSYIHFQYARSIAELHPFRYTPGAAPTPGATSLLWPLALAPFHAAGFDGERLVYVAWALGFLSLALLTYETAQLARGLVGETTAVAAGALVPAFGGFTWFAASGMEVLPFAWLLTRTCRRAVEWTEGRAPGPAPGELLALAALCPLMRPEGALGSLLVAGALLLAPRGSLRLMALPALGAPLLPSLICLLFTGQAVASTALAKWLPLNPYFDADRLAAAVAANVGTFFGTLLDGRLWTSVLLPEGLRYGFAAALAAIPVAGARSGRFTRAGFTLLLALGILIPTTYETFLVNRLRYIWPFFPAWLVGVACLGEGLAALCHALLARVGAPRPDVATLFTAVTAGLLSSKLPAAIDDLAGSAAAVTAQQVWLGKWARDGLPEGARIGLNDTGAIAYFSGHPTFDVVGLTTAGEARYWNGGAGSRFEHYERLSRDALPTHFIVYPEWLGVDAVLGDELASRTVHHTILGGSTMAARVARYELLRTGEAPLDARFSGRPAADALDVADLDSERAHRYELLGATEPQNVVVAGAEHADGARLERTRDVFDLKVVPGGTLVARWAATEATLLSVTIGGRRAAEPFVEASGWTELVVPVPRDVPGGVARIEVETKAGPFASLHYWSFE